MTDLRKLMLEELERRNYSASTSTHNPIVTAEVEPADCQT